MLTSVDLGKVSVIEARAFEYATEIKTIALPETLTTIGDFAFAHTSVSSFVIPGSVNEIGRAILAGCTKLKALTIPYVGKTISAEGEEVKLGYFFGTSSYNGTEAVTQNGTTYYVPTALVKVVVTKAVKIGDFAFYGMKNLTEIVLPDTVETIGTSAFVSCSKLERMTLNNVMVIGSSAFQGCTSLKAVTFGNKLKTIGGAAFASTKLQTVDLPSTVTEIGANAFNGIRNLRTIIVRTTGTVLTYNTSMFAGCSAYAKVFVPDELLSSYKSKWSQLGADKFYGLSIVKNNGMAISGTTLVQYFGTNESVTIPSNVATILPYAFYGNAFVRSVVIPGSVETISTYAFAGCSALETVRMNIGVRKIDASAFAGCEKLTTVIFPATLTSIGSNAFDGCTGITELTLPGKLGTIGSYAFKNVQITTIVVPKSVTSIGAGAFQGCPLENITLPFVGGSRSTSASVEGSRYTLENGGSKYLFGYIFGGECSTTGYTTDGKIYQGQGAKWDYYYDRYYAAFMGCANLSEITLPFVGMDNTASYNQNQVFGYIFGYNTTAGDDRVMQYNGYYYYIPKTLKSVTITSEKVIGKNAFINCDMLESITIQGDVESIGDYAFYSCSNLKSITVLTTTVPTLSSYAFNSDSTAVIYVKADMVEQFKSATGWKDFTIQTVQ